MANCMHAWVCSLSSCTPISMAISACICLGACRLVRWHTAHTLVAHIGGTHWWHTLVAHIACNCLRVQLDLVAHSRCMHMPMHVG